MWGHTTIYTLVGLFNNIKQVVEGNTKEGKPIVMRIWVNGLKNNTSANATLILKGDTHVMCSGAHLHYNEVTEDNTSPFQADIQVEGVNRSFNVYDGNNWDLVVTKSFSAGKQSLNITRNYGEYAIIVGEKGIVIEDVSKDSYALALNGQTAAYYKFFIKNGYLTVEASGQLD